MRLSVAESTMASSPFDARGDADSRNQGQVNPSKYRSSRAPLQYETTPNGDVVVVEPSFDEGEDGNTKAWQARSPTGDKSGATDVGERSSPNRDTRGKRRHTRNLSEHFFDATTLSSQPEDAEACDSSRASAPYSMRGPPPSTQSAAAGQKHRRVFSGDVSNPPNAHRRINSIGNSATVKRSPYGPGARQHQRVDSAGLDVLTAAADASREELEAAAGHPHSRHQRNSWDPQTANSSRRQTVEMTSYDYTHGVMNAPPPRNHHRPYHPFNPHQPQRYIATTMAPHLGPPPSFPQAAYAHSTFYPPGPSGYSRPMPPSTGLGFPVQYARGQDLNAKQPPQQPGVESQSPESDGRQASPTAQLGDERGVSDEQFGNPKRGGMTPPPPVPPPHWRGGPGTNQGVQTFVTAIGVEEGSKTLQPTAAHRNASTNTEPGEPNSSIPSSVGHHRKLSSFSSIGPLSSIFHAPPGDGSDHPFKGHHRSTSSSLSFLQAFDVGLEGSDAAFLHNLQVSNAAPVPEFSGSPNHDGDSDGRSSSPEGDAGASSDPGTKLAPGGTSKRVRRKCTVANCPNRVVQGGLCISHGAKRKTCKHPGCSKNVKKAGLCSTHGPARKRCETEGCSKVAVQGGRCIAHGAKKKLCSVENCAKQAILGGMCKKHHDQNGGSSNHTQSDVPAPPGSDHMQCKVIDEASSGGSNSGAAAGAGAESSQHRKKTHTRGLSIFQDLSADAVGNLLSTDGIGVEPVPDRGTTDSPPDGVYNRSGNRTTYSREFGMF